jgi:hypothetical protein
MQGAVLLNVDNALSAAESAANASIANYLAPEGSNAGIAASAVVDSKKQGENTVKDNIVFIAAVLGGLASLVFLIRR